jgi:hypothetical protein
LSRFRLLALFATLAVLATVFAACGGSDDESGTSSSGSDDPQELVENFVFEGVKSGVLDFSMHVDVKGENAAEFEVNVSGPFEQGAKGELPQLEMTGEISGEGENLGGGLTVLTDRAFIDYDGTVYEVDPTTFGFVKAALEQGQQEGGKEDITACQKAAEGIKFSQFTENLKSEGSVEVEGTETTKVSGDVDAPAFIDTVIELTESPACASQLEAAGQLPQDDELKEAQKEVAEAIKRSHIELYVGEDDIARKMVIEMTIAPQKTNSEGDLEMEFTLSGVNEEQSFSAPSNAQPLEGLFQKLGVNPLEFLEGGGAEGLSGLLEGLLEGETPAGGSGGGGGPSASDYAECLQEAETTADIQKCANLRK